MTYLVLLSDKELLLMFWTKKRSKLQKKVLLQAPVIIWTLHLWHVGGEIRLGFEEAQSWPGSYLFLYF